MAQMKLSPAGKVTYYISEKLFTPGCKVHTYEFDIMKVDDADMVPINLLLRDKFGSLWMLLGDEIIKLFQSPGEFKDGYHLMNNTISLTNIKETVYSK